MSDSESFDDCSSFYSSTSSDNNSPNDRFYEQYVLKHVELAFEKFANIKNTFLKNLIIIWYLIYIINIRPIDLIQQFTFSDFFTKLLREYDNYHAKEDCCFEYHLHSIKDTLEETMKLETELTHYLKTPLDNSFIPRLREILWRYKHRESVCKTSVEGVFKCLTRNVDIEYLPFITHLVLKKI